MAGATTRSSPEQRLAALAEKCDPHEFGVEEGRLHAACAAGVILTMCQVIAAARAQFIDAEEIAWQASRPILSNAPSTANDHIRLAKALTAWDALEGKP